MNYLAQLSAALADRYRIERELGAGGMATVYLARDLKHDRDVALKVLKPELGAVLGADRFLAEIKVTANLRHPNLLPLFDSGAANGLLYYVMPYIEGLTLREKLQQSPQLPVADVQRMVGLLAGALDYAHAAGVVHRDLKPENILLQAGQPVIADFGIALAVAEAGGERITQTGLSLGTPLYMSPEQASGERAVDARSDQYALAAITYEMLTGEPPHTGATASVIIARLMSEAPRSVRSSRTLVSSSIDAAVLRALAKSSGDRFSTCSDFASALSATDTSRTTGSVRLMRYAVAALTITAVALASVMLYKNRPPTTAVVEATNKASVAVLPFSDLSPDRTSEYFGDGIAETLISALANVPDLRVAARTSAFSFRGKNVDVREIAEKLGVSTVLEGSVQRAGDKLRITAQLVNASDGVNLWSKTFDRSATDIFAVQDEVALAVIGALKGSVLAGKSQRTGTTTRDAPAYDLYLQGRFFAIKRSTADVQQAIGLFEQAIARDSLFVDAWVGIADAYILQAYYSDVSPTSTLAKARAASDRAVALDSFSGMAQTTRAYLMLVQDWNWYGADSAFARAVALSPSYATAYKWWADVKSSLGQPDEALRMALMAWKLDPLSAVAHTNVGLQYQRLHQDSVAGEWLNKSLTIDPGLPLALRTLLLRAFDRGDSTQFFALYARYANSSSRAGASVADVRRAWQQGGKADVIRTQVAALQAPDLAFDRAMWRVRSGDASATFQDLNMAYEKHSIWMQALRFYIGNSEYIVRDPRYAAMLKRLGQPVDSR